MTKKKVEKQEKTKVDYKKYYQEHKEQYKHYGEVYREKKRLNNPNYQEMIKIMGEHPCTKGHEEKCLKGESKNCSCECGGLNHGKFNN